MQQRYVIVPAPIKLVNPSTRKPLMMRITLANGRVVDSDKEHDEFTIRRMIIEVILADPKLGTGWRAALVASALLVAFDTDPPEGTVIPLMQEHWEKVKDILESGGVGLDPIVNGQIVPMYKAFIDAKDKPPSEE